MKTQIERLPECCSSIDLDLSFEKWISKIHPVNRLPQNWNQEDSEEMSIKRILVIDDEIKIREMYRKIFYSIGYVVVTAGDAVEAYDLLLRHRYDIVLLDINMAQVDGPTLYEVMKTFHKDIKVVVSSVYSIHDQKERIKDADAYFDKSDDKDVLVSIVSSIFC